jgi:hypothetical protein
VLGGLEGRPDPGRLEHRRHPAVHHEHLAVDRRAGTSGATCSGASASTEPSSGGGPIKSAVIAVRARGQIALARTP